MQVFGVENQAKGFMIMMRKFFILTVFVIAMIQCRRDNNTNLDPIPEVPVNTTINLALKAPFLDIPGSFFYEPGGFHGLVVVHDFDGTIRVFDRTCSFQPLTACNKLFVDTLTLQFKCGDYDSIQFNTCCDSRFDFGGFVVKTPAQFPIKQYRSSLAGNFLTVVN